MIWSRECHKYPCPETDHIDDVLNDAQERTYCLNPTEIQDCIRWGRLRHEASRNLRDLKVSPRSGLYIDTMGVSAEYVGCRYLGFPFKLTINTFRQADLPCNIEIRCRSRSDYACKIRPDDDDSRRVVKVLATDLHRPIVLVGWIEAWRGKTFKTIDPRDAGQPFHAVPDDELNPMKELKKIVAQARDLRFTAP